MTKQEVYDKFFDSLTPEEIAAGAEALPDYVVYIRDDQPRITREQIHWAKMIDKMEIEEFE